MFRSQYLAGFILLSILPWVSDCEAEPIVAGLVNSELAPELRGRVLIEELNCVACHSSEAAFAGESKKAPRLVAVGSRVNPHYLAEFLRDPHAAKPGTTMPDVLRNLSDEERGTAAQALTHFLLSQRPNDFSPQAPDRVAAQHGERLFHSRGCVACHAPRDAEGKEDATLLPSSAPLGGLTPKYSFRSLVEFLRNPHAVRPSGRMPDLRLAGRDLEQIAHYLLQNTKVPGSLEYMLYRGQVWEGLDSDEVEAERAGQVADFAQQSLGKVAHQTAIEYAGWLKIERPGAYRFFLEMNGGSLRIDGREVAVLEPSNRRGPKKIEAEAQLESGRRRIELRYFHTGREPKFAFEMQGPQFARQTIPSSMLSVSRETIEAFEPVEIDAQLADRGRKLFAELRCANCHDDVKTDAPNSRPAMATNFTQLKPEGGCLSGTAGPWPAYSLGDEQLALIRAALPKVEKQQLNDQQRVDKTLVAFNCLACHDRAGLGGVDLQRLVHFSGTREALGNQGRVPPPLSHVGAKLTPQWIADVMLHGKRQRPYLDASMPQFGEANVGHLVELFGKVDTLEEVTIPEVTDIKESKHAGYEMMGVEGFSCIACHDFNGSPAGGAGALDLVSMTSRVQKNWFHLYMREPSRFHSTVIMPNYWPGGKSVRPEVLGGDTTQQIEALWNYLEDGPRAKKPAGLSRESNELRVFDVAEICRGRGTAGYRGIGVGYPQGVHLAFDSEEMALRLLWKGEFANVNHGSFQARGGERIAFPPGIPFHRLESMDDDWPYKGKTDFTFPQNLGYRFRGYELDELRRPTFFYDYGDIQIADFFEGVAAADGREGDGKAWFRRTIQFEAKGAQHPFHFRAAAGEKVSSPSEREFRIDQLTLRLDESYRGIVREGEPAEVLVPLTLPAGRSTLTLEYRW